MIRVHCMYTADRLYTGTWVTSRDLANNIGISHERMLKKIKKVTNNFTEFESYFSESFYVDVKNRCTRPMFEIDQQGVDLLINRILRFRKKKALLLLNDYHMAFDFTEKYAKANELERDQMLSSHYRKGVKVMQDTYEAKKPNEQLFIKDKKDGVIYKVKSVCMCEKCRERGMPELELVDQEGNYVDYITMSELFSSAYELFKVFK